MFLTASLQINIAYKYILSGARLEGSYGFGEGGLSSRMEGILAAVLCNKFWQDRARVNKAWEILAQCSVS